MENNVMSWGVALEKGYEPRLYSYTIESVPLGEYEALLDFKIWAKKTMGICCYFTQKETRIKFQLTVFRRPKDKLYMIKGCDLDFTVYAANALYLISVGLNAKQNITFKNAVACTK